MTHLYCNIDNRLYNLLYYNNDNNFNTTGHLNIDYVYNKLSFDDKEHIIFHAFGEFIDPIINCLNKINKYYIYPSESDEESEEEQVNSDVKEIFDILLYNIDDYISIKDKIWSEELYKKDCEIKFLLDKINMLESKISASTCINGTPDMRYRKNKGKNKYNNIIGNTHINYIDHPNCKLCKMSICGRCVKHGG